MIDLDSKKWVSDGKRDNWLFLTVWGLITRNFLQSYVNGDDRYGTSQGAYDFGTSLTNRNGIAAAKSDGEEEVLPKILL